MNNNNITWHNVLVSRKDREKLHGHKGAVIWLTGLSASGKSTVAHMVEKELFLRGCSTYVFDGDNVRHGLCSDLSFSASDRTENIRRIGEMVKLFIDAGVIVLTAFISPFRKDRERIRSLISDISSPYEPPLAPELNIDSAETSADEAVHKVISMLEHGKII